MNILFIFSLQENLLTAKPLQSQEQIQFGISYISALLKKHGHKTKLLVLTRQNYKVIDEYLKNFCPGLICFTAVSTEYLFMAHIAQHVKNIHSDIFLLAGGPHVTLNPQDCISGAFDALCVGEGEYPVLELVQYLEKGNRPSGISNLWIKRGSEIEKNPARPFLQNIDELPFPDREMWQKWIAVPESRYAVLLGRGCLFQCTYCCNHALRKIASGPYLRLRSPDNIIKEITGIIKKNPEIKEIYLEVESFGVNLDWAVELCEKLENMNKKLNSPVSFGVNLRIVPGADLKNLFAALKKSNFKIINIGLESGSERIRREVLKRNYSNEDVIKTVGLAREQGLQVAFFNLIGVPGETVEDFKETVKINRICLPDGHLTSIFYPYQGTDLYDLCQEQGLLNKHLGQGIERKKAVLDLPGFSKKQIQKSYEWFDYYVYKGIKPLYKLTALGLLYKLYSNPRLARLAGLAQYYIRVLKKNISG